MQDQEAGAATPDKKIADQARTWRGLDKEAIADKRDVEKQRREFRARQHLRRVIDDAGAR
jgi:hypothetical protein